jgi:diguanylate cyclase (GGDEF)-like protein
MSSEIIKNILSDLKSFNQSRDKNEWKNGFKRGMEKAADHVNAEAWVLSFDEDAFPLFLGKGIVGEVGKNGKPSVVADSNEDPEQFRELEKKIHSHLHSFLAVPLLVHNKTVGVIEVVNKVESDAFTEEDLIFLSPISEYISLILENHLLQSSCDRRVEELSLLSEVGRAITSILDINQLLEKSAYLIRSRFQYFNVAIYITEMDQHRLHLKAFEGAPGIEPARKTIGIGREGIIGWSAKTGESILVPDVSQEEKYIRGIKGIQSEMVIPIKRDKEILGVLDIGSDEKNTFKEDDLRMMNLLVRQLAIALVNARLVHKVEELAITDDLTQLFNTRYCNLYLEKHVERGEEVSIIFLDLDFFKRVDDSYGHRIGALTLKEVANRIREGVREGDICSRYGGDEYVVILPNTSLETAARVARSLKESFENKLFWIENRIPISVTASFGVASYPKCAKSPWDLLVKADQAMYEVKTSGRNDVAVAEEL